MDNLDKLIEELKKAKDYVAKNVNMSYAGPTNQASGSMGAVTPATMKMDDAAANKTGAPTPSPKAAHAQMQSLAQKNESPEAVDRQMRSVAEKGEGGKTKHDRCVEHVKGKVDNPHAVCVSAGVEPEAWKKSKEEYLELFKNGQWEIKKVGFPMGRGG